MGFEPTTSTLARLRSTPELLPHHIFHLERIDGNRTVVLTLEGCGSTIELYPRFRPKDDSLGTVEVQRQSSDLFIEDAR